MRPASVASSIITIHQPPSIPQNNAPTEMGSETTEIRHTSTEFNALAFAGSDIDDTDIFTLSEDEEESDGDKEKKESDRSASFEKLEGGSGASSSSSTQRLSATRSPGVSTMRNRRTRRVPEAFIELKEEKVHLPS